MTDGTNRNQMTQSIRLVYEEDIEEAVHLCATILGKQGRMVHPMSGNLTNVILSTEAHGKLWYGDLLANEVHKVHEIQVRLGHRIDMQPL